jgi:hypothetical protein
MTTSQSPRQRSTVPPGLTPDVKTPGGPLVASGSRRVLAMPVALAVLIASFALLTRQPVLERTFVVTAILLVAWSIGLFVTTGRSQRTLSLHFVPRAQHWLQASTQFSVILWWAWHTPLVFAFLPFYFVQLVFAFAFDSLLNWSRRDVYTLGFGPFPVILSINLFLLFKPEWFYWQFVLVALGFAAKELIRWDRDGRKAHIFNPSSFPLAVFSFFLLLTRTTDITFGNYIANTIFDTPYIFLAVFLLALPVQILFGVMRMTLAAAATMYVTGLIYLAVTGTYFFYDAYIPPAVFIGMTLLVTDPSTSPRTELGRFFFGALYALGTMVLFVVLERMHAPSFYDKLLPIPILNLMVRWIDSVARSKPFARFAPEQLGKSLAPIRRNLAFVGLWAAVFVGMYAAGAVGEHHPGQYLPFWHNACGAGSNRACSYVATMNVVLCKKGSGWACNQAAILNRRRGLPAEADFRRACDLGSKDGCDNLAKAPTEVATLASDPPALADLPIVLSGTKPTLEERDPTRLYAIACEQGWPGACDGAMQSRQ